MKKFSVSFLKLQWLIWIMMYLIMKSSDTIDPICASISLILGYAIDSTFSESCLKSSSTPIVSCSQSLEQ